MTTDEAVRENTPAAIKPTQLSVRLMEIVSMVPRCTRILDIGSDHGHVPSYILENRIAERAVATDIHADPAETTRRYLRRQGVMQHAEVYQTDGLHGISLQAGDAVIMSGLGGLETIRILSESLAGHNGSFPPETVFICQPQRSIEELRVFFNSSGFTLDDEKICLDRNKFYSILRAKWTGAAARDYSLTEFVLGPCILKNRPVHFPEYLHHQRNVVKKHMRARPELSAVVADIDRILGEL